MRIVHHVIQMEPVNSVTTHSFSLTTRVLVILILKYSGSTLLQIYAKILSLVGPVTSTMETIIVFNVRKTVLPVHLKQEFAKLVTQILL
jgi:hypothetical protein